MRIFATSPPDRPLPPSGHQDDQPDHFRAGAFCAGAGTSPADNLPSLEDELAADPLLQLLPSAAARPPSTVSVASDDTETQFLMSSDSGGKGQVGGVDNTS